jgi:putative MATE family efflux protein
LVTDMTVGSPLKVLLKFSIPIFISVIFQQLYNVIDSMVAGKFVGVNALAAVGASYSIVMIFTCFATGMNSGCSVIISQLFGAGKNKEVKTAISTSIIAVTVTAVVLTILGLVFCRPLLHMMSTPKDIFEDSVLYLQIYILGVVFVFLYNAGNAIFTALGDSRTPLYFLIFSSVVNVVLDLVFVLVFHLGVAGIGIATVIAQGISAVLCLWYLKFRLKGIITEEKIKWFDSKILKSILKISIPSILQQSSNSVGQLFLQGLINSYGALVVAGFTAGSRLSAFAVCTIITIETSMSGYTAQNMGAKKYDRIREGAVASFKIVCGLVIFALVSYQIFAEPLVGLFVEAGNEEVIRIGARFIRMVSPFYIVIIFKLIADGVMRGSGTVMVCMADTIADLAMRVISAYVLAYFFGIENCWWSWGIGWTIGMFIAVGYYITGKWKDTKSIE